MAKVYEFPQPKKTNYERVMVWVVWAEGINVNNGVKFGPIILHQSKGNPLTVRIKEIFDEWRLEIVKKNKLEFEELRFLDVLNGIATADINLPKDKKPAITVLGKDVGILTVALASQYNRLT
jgi:hypothetical protein